MPSALMIELDKPSAGMGKIANKAASKTNNELTAHPGDRGSYFVWARIKPTQQTKLAPHPKSLLHQGRLSFALPTMVVAGQRKAVCSLQEKHPANPLCWKRILELSWDDEQREVQIVLE